MTVLPAGCMYSFSQGTAGLPAGQAGPTCLPQALLVAFWGTLAFQDPGCFLMPAGHRAEFGGAAGEQDDEPILLSELLPPSELQ